MLQMEYQQQVQENKDGYEHIANGGNPSVECTLTDNSTCGHGLGYGGSAFACTVGGKVVQGTIGGEDMYGNPLCPKCKKRGIGAEAICDKCGARNSSWQCNTTYCKYNPIQCIFRCLATVETCTVCRGHGAYTP